MAVKASVDTQNQTTVRVGQQNAVKVTSTQTGIASAVNATNIVGGRADVTQLAVSGLSTFTGIGTFVSDLYVGGDLYLTDDLVLDNISGSSLNISGVSTVGFITATDVWVSGAVTATTYYGDGSNLTGLTGTANTSYVSTNSLVVLGISTVGFITATDVWVSGAVTATSYYGDGTNLTGIAITGGDNTFSNLYVSGISTLGVTSATDLEAQQLSVSGVSTFNDAIEAKDNVTVDGQLYVASNIRHKGDTDTYIEFTSDKLRFLTGGKEFVNITQSGASSVVINEQPDYDCDFRVEGISDEHLIFTDAVTDKVGIGSAIPKAKLDVNGTLNVAGVTTFNQDVNFPGAAYNIHWDQPTSKFKFDDSAQLVFGSASGGDMKLFHQSGNSTIRNETGQFRIAGNDIRLQTQNHSEDYLLAVDGGSVSIFYNDVKRLETSGIGITVTGITSTTDLYVTGLSTYIGVTTYKSDVFIDGTLTAGVIDGGTY